VSCLILKRSVLTEKIARHGLHLTREYSTDPLEAFFVNEVMDITPLTLAPGDAVTEVATRLTSDPHAHSQRLLPVMGADGELTAVVTIGVIMTAYYRGETELRIADLMMPDVTTVFDNDTLRH